MKAGIDNPLEQVSLCEMRDCFSITEQVTSEDLFLSGLRMAYGNCSQALGRAEERQLDRPSMGLTHNLGGVPYQGVAAISILGLY